MSTSKKKRLLLVEDEALLAMTEKMQLEQYGYSVRTVSSGEAAVETVESAADIDLILMDINLGSGIDGTQAAELILNDHDIPVVFLSSHTEPEVVEKTEKITSYGYVVKNSSPTVLDASIKMAFKLFDAMVNEQNREEELRRSAETARRYLNVVAEIVVSLDTDGFVTLLNNSGQDLLGWEHGELLGKNWFDTVIPAETRPEIRRVFDVLMAGDLEPVMAYENEILTKVGERRTVLWHNSLIFDDHGTITGVLTSGHDVTEWKRTEDELRRFKTISDNALNGQAIVDLHGNLLYVNRYIAGIHGYEPRELVGKHLSVFHNDHQLEAAERLNKAVIHEGHHDSATVWHCHRDGTEFPMLMSGILLRDADGNPQYIAATAVDITEREQTKKVLAESVQLLSRAQKMAHIGNWHLDLTTNHLSWSDEIYRMFGYKPQEFTATYEAFLESIHPDDRAAVDEAYTRSLEDGSNGYEIKHRIVRRGSDDIRYVHEQCEHERDAAGTIIRSTGMVQDITENTRINQELTQEKEYLETILETSSDGFWVVSPDRRITSVNAAYCRMSGYSADELSEMKINDLDAIEEPQETAERLKRIMDHGSETFQTKHRRKDGTVFDVEISVSRLLREDGPSLVCFCRDITQRERMRQELEESRQQYQMLVDTSPDIIYLFGTQRGGIFWSEATRRILGYEPDAIVRDPYLWTRSIHSDDQHMVETAIAGAINGEPFDIEYRIKTRSDDWVWLRDKLIDRTEKDGEVIIQGHAEDITKEKRNGQQLSEKNALLNDVMDNMLDLIAITDLDGSFLYAGRSHESLGYSVASLIGRNVADFVHPDDVDTVTQKFSAFLESQTDATASYRYRRADGTYVWLETACRLLRNDDGTPSRILFNSREITERKQREDALIKERHRLSATIEGTDVGTWEWNVQSGETRFNEKWASIIGYTLDEISPVSIETWQRFAHEEDLQRSEQLLNAHFNGDTERYEIETRMRHKDGHWVWVLDRGKVATWTADGNPEWLFGTHQETTERKQAEEELKAISNMQSIILRMASDYIDVSRELVDETINRSLQELGFFVGADRTYVFEYDWENGVANNTYEWCNESIRPEIDNLQGVPNGAVDYWVEAHRNGDVVSIEDVAQLPLDAGVRRVLEPQGIRSVLALPMMRKGECIGFVGFDSVGQTKQYTKEERALLQVFSEMLVNVIHRTELENDLIHAKEQAEASSADLTAIIDGTTDSIWSFDRNYDIRYVNEGFRTDFYSAFGVRLEKGTNLIDALPEELRPIWKPRYDRALSNERFIVTDEVDAANGKQFIQVCFNPIIQGDTVIGGSCFGSDITNRKLSELEVQKQLDEKESLLREVHHRVKNNMATIEGLLSLQAGSTGFPEVKTALQDTISRVQSMRVLYDKLLLSTTLHEIRIEPYANGLIDALARVFDPDNKTTIERHIADFEVPPKKAFVLGIIINELLTNVFKYAFQDHDNRKLSVTIGKQGDTVSLLIHDNGIGFDERALKNESPGFGLTVIKMLVEQTGGTYRLSNDNGARSFVEFAL